MFRLTLLCSRNAPETNWRRLSCEAILSEIDHNLQRRGTASGDRSSIHRWDDQPSIEETMKGLHDVVKAGKTHSGST